MSTPGNTESTRSFLLAAGLPVDTEVDVRRIGTDAEMIRLIIERIAIGEKTMTYSLPWLREHTGQPEPVAGMHIIALDAQGNPALLMRLRQVKVLRFGSVGPADVAEEGIPMRDIKAWRPLHIAVWNEKLSPYGLEVSDDMPVTAEYFEVLHSADPAREEMHR